MGNLKKIIFGDFTSFEDIKKVIEEIVDTVNVLIVGELDIRDKNIEEMEQKLKGTNQEIEILSERIEELEKELIALTKTVETYEPDQQFTDEQVEKINDFFGFD
ncbi:hypothetical protein KAS79_03325 [Candidatus Parcubacteria bacterium]|nr:hypothetical protein [Candidatus Parcubacteria bacterium]